MLFHILFSSQTSQTLGFHMILCGNQLDGLMHQLLQNSHLACFHLHHFCDFSNLWAFLLLNLGIICRKKTADKISNKISMNCSNSLIIDRKKAMLKLWCTHGCICWTHTPKMTVVKLQRPAGTGPGDTTEIRQ